MSSCLFLFLKKKRRISVLHIKKKGRVFTIKGRRKKMSGIYTGAMGIMSYMTKLDVVSNNVANAQTKGYKKDTNSFRTFEETHMVQRNFQDKQSIGKYEHMVYADDIQTRFETGMYETSDEMLDMAIQDSPTGQDKTFFVVGKNENQYLTKNGQFTLDEQRRLSTYTGELVLGTDGKEITIPEGTKYTVNTDGTVQEYGSNRTYGKIQMATVEDKDLVFLQKERGSLFSVMNINEIENRFAPINDLLGEVNQNITYKRAFGTDETLRNIQQTGQVNIIKPVTGKLQTNTVENSNVDMATEMVGLMEAQRGVQMSQKAWQTMSEILDQESSQIGR